MKTKQEQKEINKLLNEMSKVYSELDKLKAENNMLKKEIKRLFLKIYADKLNTVK